MRAGILVLILATVLLALSVQASSPSFEQMAQNIEQQQSLSSKTMGDFFGPIEKALKAANISVTNVTASVHEHPYGLTASMVVHLGDVEAPMSISLQNGTSAAEINLDVVVGFTMTVQAQNWTAVFSRIHGSMPAELAGVDVSGSVTVKVANADFAGYTSGLSASAAATLSNDQYLKPFRLLNPEAQTFSFTLDVASPIFTDQSQFSFAVTETGMLHVTKSISVGDATLSLSSVTKSFEVGGAVSVQMSSGPLTASMKAAYALSSDDLSLSGTLDAPVGGVLGLSWLKLDQATASLDIVKGQFTQMTFDGKFNVSQAAQEVDGTFHINENGQMYAAVTDMPLPDLAAFVRLVDPKAAAAAASVTTKGAMSLSVSDYAASSAIPQGLQLSGVVTITDDSSDVVQASKAVGAGAGTTHTYTMSLFAPILGATAPVKVSFSEDGDFRVNPRVTCSSYSVSVIFGAAKQVQLQAAMAFVPEGQTTPVAFTASGSWNQGQGVRFAGTLTSAWAHPMQAQWLELEAGSAVSFTAGGSASPDFKVSGSAQLTFVPASSPANFELSVGGADMSSLVIAVTNVPLKAVDVAFKDITGRKAPKAMSSIVVGGTAGISLATSAGADVPQGIVLQAEVQVAGESSLDKALHLIASGQRTYDYKLSFNPFQKPAEVEASVSESGKLVVSKSLTLNSYSVDIDVGGSNSFDVRADISVLFRHATTPAEFALSGTYSGGAGATLSGNLVGTWEHPFGSKWLEVDTLTASLTVGGSAMSRGSISGMVAVVSGTQSANATVSASISNSFEDFALILTVGNVFKMEDLVETVSGDKPSSLLSGLAADSDVSLDIAVCTQATSGYQAGITLDTKGTFSGDLKTEMDKHLYFLKKWDVKSFDVTLYLPVFSANKGAISLDVNVAEHATISSHIALSDVDLGLQLAPFAAHLDTTFTGTFEKNPPLVFELDGAYGSGGAIDFSSTMLGTWENAFGLRGFNLSNVELKLGFSPESPVYHISDLGLGATMAFGETEIIFDGNVAFPKLDDIFVLGEYKHTEKEPTVVDVVHTWNKQNPLTPVDASSLPAVTLQEAKFQLATGAGSFAGVTYQAGLEIALIMEVVGMDLATTINCTEGGGSLTNDCHFGFHVNVDRAALEELLKKELEHFDLIPADTDMSSTDHFELFHLNSAHIGQWSQHNQAHGTPATFTLDFVFFNHHKVHTVDIKHQASFFTSFRSFFGTFLHALFTHNDEVPALA